MFEKIKIIILENLPAALVTIGIICFIIAAIFLSFDMKAWASFFLSGGSTILASGVFSLLMKTRQFHHFFEEKLTQILYGKDFLKKRTDLGDVWGKVTECFLERHNKEFADSLTEKLKDNFLDFPDDNCYYCKEHLHTITIKWENQSEGLVKVAESLTYDFYLLTEKTVVSGEFRSFSPDKYPIIQNNQVFIDGSKIESQDIDPSALEKQKFFAHEISDSINQKHTFKRERTSIINLRQDPTMNCQLKYSFSPKVVIVSEDSDLDFLFETLGTRKPFTSHKTGDDKKTITRSYKYDGLMLREQGYALIIMEKVKTKTSSDNLE